VKKVLDGDMLGQFLELTSSQQQSILADQPGLESLSTFNLSLQTTSRGGFPVEQVLRLLERIYKSLT
jgi:splicing factor 3B subunit 3